MRFFAHFDVRILSKLTFCFYIILFFSSTLQSKEVNLESKKWVNSCPNDSFCFTHPQDMLPKQIQVMDSNAGQFSNDAIELTYDLGWYASSFSNMTGATRERVMIDGRPGIILIQDNSMALSVPQVEGKIRFSMLLSFKESMSKEQGNKIFSSITFLSVKNP